MEKPIIPPVDKALLREEFARATEWPEASHGAIKLYCIDVGFPAILREISRLREIAFRSGGGAPENWASRRISSPRSNCCGEAAKWGIPTAIRR